MLNLAQGQASGRRGGGNSETSMEHVIAPELSSITYINLTPLSIPLPFAKHFPTFTPAIQSLSFVLLF